MSNEAAAGLARSERAATLEEAVQAADSLARKATATGSRLTGRRRLASEGVGGLDRLLERRGALRSGEAGRGLVRHVRRLRGPGSRVQGSGRRARVDPEEGPMTIAR